MYIDTHYFIFINIAIIIFLILNIIRGYKEGFLNQVVSLFGLILAMIIAKILSPVFADMFDLWPHSWYIANQAVFDVLLYDTINNLAWFILLVIVLKLIFILFRPLVKFISSIPLIKQINKGLGLISGSIIGLLWLFVFYMVMASPLIVNNDQVIEGTFFKQYDQLTVAMLNEQNLDKNNWQQWINADGLSPQDQEALKKWLIEHGVDDIPIEEFTQGAQHE